jgi:hypothetical protein
MERVQAMAPLQLTHPAVQRGRPLQQAPSPRSFHALSARLLRALCAPSAPSAPSAPYAHPPHPPLRPPPCTRSEPPQAVPLLSPRGASGASALLGPSAGGDPGGSWEGGVGPYPDYLDSGHEGRHEGHRQGPRVARGYFGCGDGGGGAGGYSQDDMCAIGPACATP